MGPQRSESAARLLIEQGARGLVSWGCAGGLASELAPGSVVIPATVIDENQRHFEIDANWRAEVLSKLRGQLTCTTHALLSGAQLVTSSLAKQAAAASTGACAVDMESSAVGAVATAAQLPFLVVRVIADPLSISLPAFLPEVTDEYGQPIPHKLTAALLRRPTELPNLLALQRCWTQSLRTLRKAAYLLGYAQSL